MIYGVNYNFPYKYIVLVTCRYRSSKAFGKESVTFRIVAEFCCYYTEKKSPVFTEVLLTTKIFVCVSV